MGIIELTEEDVLEFKLSQVAEELWKDGYDTIRGQICDIASKRVQEQLGVPQCKGYVYVDKYHPKHGSYLPHYFNFCIKVRLIVDINAQQFNEALDEVVLPSILVVPFNHVIGVRYCNERRIPLYIVYS